MRTILFFRAVTLWTVLLGITLPNATTGEADSEGLLAGGLVLRVSP